MVVLMNLCLMLSDGDASAVGLSDPLQRDRSEDATQVMRLDEFAALQQCRKLKPYVTVARRAGTPRTQSIRCGTSPS